MNSAATITKREAVPVDIGSMTLWCEEFKAAAVRTFAEEPLAAGGGTITNSCPKAMKLTFSGRIFGGPLEFVKTASDMLRDDTTCSVKYRGLVFSGCHVQSFSSEDKGEDFIHAAITLISAEAVGEEETP